MKVDLKKDSIAKLIVNFSFPAIGGMLVSALYVIVDGIFIGRGVGAEGLAAINIAYPVITLGLSLSMMFGVGGSTIISILQGEGNTKKTGEYLSYIITLTTVSYLIILVLTLTFQREIIYFLGSSNELYFMVRDYLITGVIFLIFFMLSIALNAVVRNDNSPSYAMFSMVIGTVINIILDWIFILELGMGMKGAALATGIAQMGSFLFLVVHFFRKKCTLRPKLSLIDPSSAKRIAVNGLSSFIMELATAIVLISFNRVLMVHLGDKGAAAFGAISYVFYIFTMIFTGLAQGIQPVISYNFGAGEGQRVRRTLALGQNLSFIISLTILISVIFMGEEMIRLFNNEDELVKLATKGLTIYSSAIIFLGLNFVNISFFQSMEQQRIANLLSVGRSLVFVLAGLAILPRFLGVDGIWLSLPFSDFMTFCTNTIIKKKSRTFRSLASV